MILDYIYAVTVALVVVAALYFIFSRILPFN